MKIEYIHFSEPEKVKVYDTEQALKNNPYIRRNQKEYDEMEIRSFERKKKQGYILYYRIKEE